MAIYTGTIRGTVTDNLGQEAFADLPVVIEIPDPVAPFSFCDPNQWEDAEGNSPPIQWELITTESHAYEWDDSSVGYPNAGSSTAWVTYIGSDALPPGEIEVYYAYTDGGSFSSNAIRWEWLDSDDNVVGFNDTTVNNGNSSFFIGVPPLGAVTLRWEVEPFTFTTYGSYLALGCTEAVWDLAPAPPT